MFNHFDDVEKFNPTKVVCKQEPKINKLPDDQTYMYVTCTRQEG